MATAFVQESETAVIRRIYAEATSAYRDKAYAAYLDKLRTLADLRPTHPTILYKLAGAYALNNRADDAARALTRLASLQLAFDVPADPDFAAVRASDPVRDAIARMDGVRARRIGSSTVAWTVDDPTFIPEGITYDPVSRSFFVSSQYQRRIVRIDESGIVRPFVSEGQDGLWMAFGMGVDARRRLLWVASTAEPSMRGFSSVDDKRAGLFAFHLDTGKLARKIAVPPTTPAHYFDDVTVRSDGRVYLSDGGHGAIYTVAPDSEQLDVMIEPGTIQGPNGLALDSSERTMYVSDYAGFIVRIDLGTKTATRLPQPSDATLYGIDGLTYYRGSLVGIQNGVDPPRVVRLTLSADGAAIAGVAILEMNHPAFDEPTLGTIAHDALYFVANSHGGALRAAKGDLSSVTLTRPAILKLPLE